MGGTSTGTGQRRPAARPSPTRHVVLWCPHWPAVAAGLEPDVAGAVVHDQQVIAASLAARRAGVRAGMRRRDAQARCPSLVVIGADPSRDARRFEVVARGVGSIVPVVGVDEPGTVLFGARGPSRWCGGDDALAERVHALALDALRTADPPLHIDRIGVGVADGRFAAAVAARRAAHAGRPVVVAPGAAATSASLGTVGVAALADIGGVDPGMVDLFRRLGLDTLGDLAALGRREVASRFGPDGEFAHRLASGDDDRHPAGRVPAPDLAVAEVFEVPVMQIAPLVFSARRLAESLCDVLGARGERCTHVVVEVETEHGERSERSWFRSEGLGAAAMVERVRWQLEGWVNQPGGLSAGVVLLRLVPVEAMPMEGRQLGFWGEASDADERAVRAVARLVGLVGVDAVSVPERGGGRDPVDRYRWVSASAVDLDDLQARARSLQGPGHPWPGSIGTPSPAWVAEEPVAIEVLDASGVAVRVDGRGALSTAPACVGRPPGARSSAAVGDALRSDDVIAWAGPWPVDERWWDPARRRRRARFQLLTASGDALLVSVEQGAWRLEARYC